MKKDVRDELLQLVRQSKRSVRKAVLRVRDGFTCPHCGGRNTNELGDDDKECYDCGKAFSDKRETTGPIAATLKFKKAQKWHEWYAKLPRSKKRRVTVSSIRKRLLRD